MSKAYVLTSTVRDQDGKVRLRMRYVTASKERAAKAELRAPDQKLEVVDEWALRPKERENIQRARDEELWKQISRI